jgi:thiosulfate/3-mercaptopyruvate sulfurtransferase
MNNREIQPGIRKEFSMNNIFYGQSIVRMIALCTLLVCFSVRATAQAFIHAPTAGSSKSQVATTQSDSSAPQLIRPEELARTVQSSKGDKPLILQVGFHVLYVQAHIPHAEYIGPGSAPEGLQQLRKRVAALPHSQPVVLYCGCCPWSKCPNVNPAYKELRDMGFTNVKVLYIADNFGKDWVDKGYPVAKGE